MAKRGLSTADIEAQQRLERIWFKEKKRRAQSPNEPQLTQEWAGEQMDITQGAVSQYLTGRVPLGVVATMKFANLLKCLPTDIRPDFPYLVQVEQFGEEDAEFFARYAKLDPQTKQEMRDYLDFKTKYTRPALDPIA
jgi:hypothetical protein